MGYNSGMRKVVVFLAAALGLVAGVWGNNHGGAVMASNNETLFVSDMYFGYSFDGEGDRIHVFGSRAELEAYMGELIRSQPELRGLVEGFFEKYGEDFFGKNRLVIALVDRGSGSLRFELEGVSVVGSELEVKVRRISPFLQTKDMRQWVMVLGVDKGLEFGEVRVVVGEVEVGR